ncbi:cytoplasmic protein [Neoaquamicrobium sediminum]|uniref:cytoplasmic protein n=1 Tax=Neoaquamicrobium sediminum TaxID=1849104 RepID=UPI003BA953DC
MDTLCSDIHAFQRKKHHEQRVAGQTAALFLTCGVDLADALSAPRVEKKRIALKLKRLIERERLRGMRRHWSYDLNRHIALKQTLNRLRHSAGTLLD